MQWDDTANAGFTDGKPWFALNPNYPTINAKAALADPDSVFYYYQKLIAIRHQSDLIKFGDFELLDADDAEVFAYRRHYNGQTLLVISNFTSDTLNRHYDRPSEAKVLVGNYDDDAGETLRPYETKVYQY
nr:alpha-glucosidase C-terminal domain-containing protein [Secundilactobacillus similis]